MSLQLGIDLGSSHLRMCVTDNYKDQNAHVYSAPVNYRYDAKANWNYTQNSKDILEAVDICAKKLEIDLYDVVSCGIGATCSFVVCRREKNGNGKPNIRPYNDGIEDVIFWMDNTAIQQSKKINQACETYILNAMGGSFIPEMGIPKLLKFSEIVGEDTDNEYELIDLHRFLAYKLAQKYNWNTKYIINKSNDNGIGHDGELAGWRPEFYEKFLDLPPNIHIGPTNLINTNSNVFVKSYIDCYTSWFSVFKLLTPNSLFMVAGTSTCYLYMKENDVITTTNINRSIKGIWGPFTNLIDENKIVYEAGTSCSGKIIEHLFYWHPAASKELQNGSSTTQLINTLENIINHWETKNKKSYHENVRYKFYYGELNGNRTPYGDPKMTGEYIGETTDFSMDDLVDRYLCVLESLAFQTKVIIDQFEKLGRVNQLIVTGSQAKNKRLLKLISLLNNYMKIIIPKDDEELAGVKGACIIGNQHLRQDYQLSSEINAKEDSEDCKFESLQDLQAGDDSLFKLISTKYKIYIDMAGRQQKYRHMIDSIN